MLRPTADKIPPTTVSGSLPRPGWYIENLGLRSLLSAMVETRVRQQDEGALAVRVNEQAVARLDVFTDGESFSADVGGQSWTSFPPVHMSGFDRRPKPTPSGTGDVAFTQSA